MSKQDFEIIDGKTYPIIWRKKDKELTEKCPFCEINHQHGKQEGHRLPHCPNEQLKRNKFVETTKSIVLSNGHIVHRQDGYILREY